MKSKASDTPINSLLANLEHKINTLRKLNIKLDIKEQYMLQKLTTLINLLYSIDEGVNDYQPTSQDNMNEDLLGNMKIYANQLFADFEFSYEEFSKYYNTIISIYNIIQD